MNHKLTRILIATCLLAVGLLAGHVLATGAPAQTPLTYAGTITDATGKPYPAAQSVRVSFYDAASGGNLKCQSAVVQAEANTGRFAAVLPPTCVQAVHATADVLGLALTHTTNTTVAASARIPVVANPAQLLGAARARHALTLGAWPIQRGAILGLATADTRGAGIPSSTSIPVVTRAAHGLFHAFSGVAGAFGACGRQLGALVVTFAGAAVRAGLALAVLA